jgi:hypothetical protein
MRDIVQQLEDFHMADIRDLKVVGVMCSAPDSKDAAFIKFVFENGLSVSITNTDQVLPGDDVYLNTHGSNLALINGLDISEMYLKDVLVRDLGETHISMRSLHILADGQVFQCRFQCDGAPNPFGQLELKTVSPRLQTTTMVDRA